MDSSKGSETKQLLGKGSFEIKKKVKNFLSLGPDPPLNVKKDQNLFFFSDDLKDIFCRRKKIP